MSKTLCKRLDKQGFERKDKWTQVGGSKRNVGQISAALHKLASHCLDTMSKETREYCSWNQQDAERTRQLEPICPLIALQWLMPILQQREREARQEKVRNDFQVPAWN